MIVLLGRPNCHLCDFARKVLAEAGIESYQYKDISADLSLLERFSIRIPVLLVDDAELDWPFDAQAVKDWVQDHQG